MTNGSRRNIVIGQKIWTKLKTVAETEERSMSDIVRESLHDFFLKREREGLTKSYDPVSDSFRKA